MLLDLWDEFINRVREFYRNRGYLEISTPVLLKFPNLDPNVDPIPLRVRVKGREEIRWLQTSPEYSMKRILSRYSRHIFQIAKVFRNNEVGRLHRIEFHMLEWYRIGADYRYLIDEIKLLLNEILDFNEFEELTVEEAFYKHLGIRLSLSREKLMRDLSSIGLEVSEDEDWETLFYRAFIEVERKLGFEKPVFLKDFPEPLSMLAKVKNGVAERFELFIRGVEIANGWTEETDMNEVRRRLSLEAVRRGLPLDEEFINTHRNMPECAGCSVGIDRLFMILAGKESLEDVEL